MSREILKAVLAGDYARGASLFAAAKRARAEDYRWGGVCQFYLGDALNAKRLLLIAVHKGNLAARIELAACLRFEGDFTLAQAQLGLLDLATLSSMDAALALRERAILEQQCGRASQAAALLSESWAQAVSAHPSVQATVAQSLALVDSALGNDSKAAAYLRFAAEHANPMRLVYVLLAQAACATYLGDLEEAEKCLLTARRHAARCPLSGSLLHYQHAMLLRAQGHSSGAAEMFRHAAGLAREQQQPETEFYAQLGLTALATASGDEATVQASLMRAKTLINTPRAYAYLAWREGSARIRRGDPAGVALLERARGAFESRECRREVVWTLLHLAEAHERLGMTTAPGILQQAADLHAGLGSQQWLDLELNDLEHVRSRLDTTEAQAYEQVLRRRIDPPVLAEVRLVTLSSGSVTIDGVRVRLQMRKSAELLAFLLKTGESSLQAIQTELFSGVPASRSKNYIHQVRLELGRLVPGLSIPYDAARRTYRVVSSGVRLIWDVHQLGELLTNPASDFMLCLDVYDQGFLSESGSEWAQSERARLSRWIIRVGLETMDRWYRAGEYGKCLELAERLIEIEPLDEGLHEFLIRATWQISGMTAAYSAYRESQALFLSEVGQAPINLKALVEKLQNRAVN